jgi:hypothetical protein
VETARSKEAAEYWKYAEKSRKTDNEALRQAAFLLEMRQEKSGDKYRNDLMALNKELNDRQWNKKPSKDEINYVKRIMVTKDVSTGYVWIMNLADAWSHNDNNALCSAKFPLWSRVFNDGKSSQQAKNAVVKRVLALADKTIIEEKDATCQQSLLDFESKTVTESELAKKYSLRSEWPLSGAWLERQWTWSEELNSKSNREEAVKIWKKIAASGPPDAFETKMAIQRLDPKKTEFESLWKK